jgi:hypothetical protein
VVPNRRPRPFFFVVGGDGIEIIGRTLRLEMGDDRLHLSIRHERAMDALDATATLHVEHVTLAEQLFGALLAEEWCGCRSSTSPGRRCASGSWP